MIKNWNFHNLYMDYSSMYGDDHPSDIDMFYIGKNDVLIIGEIKNERGKLKEGQRKILEKLVNNWKYDAMCLFIIHNKYVQKGDKKVDVPNCYVKEYYWKRTKRWETPVEKTKVKDVLNKYKAKEVKDGFI